jgi:transcriptional regulator with XRE-family HTH domain
LVFETTHDLVSFLRKRPITKSVEVTTLPSFLRRFRTSLALRIDDVSSALGLAPEDLAKLERIDCLPWTISTHSVALILSAYRIHIDALHFLTQNSYEIARVSRKLSYPNSAARVVQTWLGEVRAELEVLEERALLHDS